MAKASRSASQKAALPLTVRVIVVRGGAGLAHEGTVAPQGSVTQPTRYMTGSECMNVFNTIMY